MASADKGDHYQRGDGLNCQRGKLTIVQSRRVWTPPCQPECSAENRKAGQPKTVTRLTQQVRGLNKPGKQRQTCQEPREETGNAYKSPCPKAHRHSLGFGGRCGTCQKSCPYRMTFSTVLA